MAVPTWITGQVVSASDVNNWFVDTVAVKPADTARTSNITLAADPDLVVAVQANCTYRVECYLDFEGGTQGASDIKWTWLVPASATLKYHAMFMGTGGGMSTNNTYAGATQVAAGSQGAGVPCGAHMIGSLIVVATSGNVTLNWAQNTSSATSTIAKAQSYLQVTRIA